MIAFCSDSLTQVGRFQKSRDPYGVTIHNKKYIIGEDMRVTRAFWKHLIWRFAMRSLGSVQVEFSKVRGPVLSLLLQ